MCSVFLANAYTTGAATIEAKGTKNKKCLMSGQIGKYALYEVVIKLEDKIDKTNTKDQKDEVVLVAVRSLNLELKIAGNVSMIQNIIPVDINLESISYPNL